MFSLAPQPSLVGVPASTTHGGFSIADQTLATRALALAGAHSAGPPPFSGGQVAYGDGSTGPKTSIAGVSITIDDMSTANWKRINAVGSKHNLLLQLVPPGEPVARSRTKKEYMVPQLMNQYLLNDFADAILQHSTQKYLTPTKTAEHLRPLGIIRENSNKLAMIAERDSSVKLGTQVTSVGINGMQELMLPVDGEVTTTDSIQLVLASVRADIAFQALSAFTMNMTSEARDAPDVNRNVRPPMPDDDLAKYYVVQMFYDIREFNPANYMSEPYEVGGIFDARPEYMPVAFDIGQIAFRHGVVSTQLTRRLTHRSWRTKMDYTHIAKSYYQLDQERIGVAMEYGSDASAAVASIARPCVWMQPQLYAALRSVNMAHYPLVRSIFLCADFKLSQPLLFGERTRLLFSGRPISHSSSGGSGSGSGRRGGGGGGDDGKTELMNILVDQIRSRLELFGAWASKESTAAAASADAPTSKTSTLTMKLSKLFSTIEPPSAKIPTGAEAVEAAEAAEAAPYESKMDYKPIMQMLHNAIAIFTHMTSAVYAYEGGMTIVDIRNNIINVLTKILERMEKRTFVNTEDIHDIHTVYITMTKTLASAIGYLKTNGFAFNQFKWLKDEYQKIGQQIYDINSTIENIKKSSADRITSPSEEQRIIEMTNELETNLDRSIDALNKTSAEIIAPRMKETPGLQNLASEHYTKIRDVLHTISSTLLSDVKTYKDVNVDFDTKWITSTPHITWKSIEKKFEAATLIYNEVKARIEACERKLIDIQVDLKFYDENKNSQTRIEHIIKDIDKHLEHTKLLRDKMQKDYKLAPNDDLMNRIDDIDSNIKYWTDKRDAYNTAGDSTPKAPDSSAGTADGKTVNSGGFGAPPVDTGAGTTPRTTPGETPPQPTKAKRSQGPMAVAVRR